MAALPKFSFSGWNSQTLAPKVPVQTPSQVALAARGGIEGIQRELLGTAGLGNTLLAQPPPAATNATGTLVGTTNAANTNLPAWLQAEVDRLNAQDALRKQLTGQVTGAPAPTQNVGDLLQGAAAQQRSAALYNQQIFGMNEAARLSNLIQQRNQLRPTGGFGFNNPMDVNRQIGLDREIEAYQNVNLPLSSMGGGRSSGWVNPFRTF